MEATKASSLAAQQCPQLYSEKKKKIKRKNGICRYLMPEQILLKSVGRILITLLCLLTVGSHLWSSCDFALLKPPTLPLIVLQIILKIAVVNIVVTRATELCRVLFSAAFRWMLRVFVCMCFFSVGKPRA